MIEGLAKAEQDSSRFILSFCRSLKQKQLDQVIYTGGPDGV